jgi:Tol biopolymer transport system component
MPTPDGTYYFWHSKYNRQVSRIMQVLRCIFPGFDGGGERNTMVFTLTADGKEVFYTGQDPVWDYPLGGHPNWHPDGEHIIRNMKPGGDTPRICQFKYDGSDFKILSESFNSSGHPSIEPTGRYIITDQRDTIDKNNQVISLIVLDTVSDKAETVCTLPTINTQGLKLITKTMRLDGHPCWSRDYKKVSLQAAPEGKRQLFVVDLSHLA